MKLRFSPGCRWPRCASNKFAPCVTIVTRRVRLLHPCCDNRTMGLRTADLVSVTSFKERVEAFEDARMSPLGTRSYPGRRAIPEEDSPVRTPFQRDRDRIIHSKAFRRLKHKTQVFISPEGDHYRTRLTHTLETTGIARTVARALALNEDLTEAIGLGHDLGHPPF